MADRWIDQNRFYDPVARTRGNCAQAAVASILGLPLEAVPNFMDVPGGSRAFWDAIEDFLAERGWAFTLVPSTFRPDVYYLAKGPSPRGVSHMVVMRSGELVHDPHPSKLGLERVEAAWLLLPLDPADMRRDPP